MAGEFRLKLRWTFFPLHPETPAEGLTLERLFAGRGIDIPAAKARMVGLMELEGLPYGDRTTTYNSRFAQEFGAWGENEKGNLGIHRALFEAYFVQGRNLSDESVLMDVAQTVGLEELEVKEALATRRGRAQVDADWQRAAELRVTGVPTFVIKNRAIEGAQPYEALRQLVLEAGAERRSF